MKKWIVRLAVAFVVLAIIGLIAIFLSINTIVTKGVNTIGPKVTQTDVRLENANISPFSGSGELHGLFVGNPSGFKTPSAVKVSDVKVAVNVKSLLSNVVVVDSVMIDSPEVTFEGDLVGVNNNLSKLLANVNAVAGTDSSEKKPEEKPVEGGKKFRVKDILIKSTKLNASLTVMGGKAVSLTLPDIHLTDIGNDSDGASAGELASKVISAIRAETIKALGSAVTGVGKQVESLGKEAGTQMEKTTKGLKSLFKK
jgi:uncharacterized protein involved in outer membrane biogenesis